MFGRRRGETKTSPNPVVPGPSRSKDQPAGEQQSKVLPDWLLPWLLPVALVLVVVAVVAPGFVAVALGLVVALLALGWLLGQLRRSPNWDRYERTRNDWFLRQRRDDHGRHRNDQLL